MSGVSKIAISESAETLKSLLKKQKTALNYAKIPTLYLLKIQVAETIRYLAVILGRLRTAHDAEIIRHPCPPESTIHHWLPLYRTGGLEKLHGSSTKNRKTKKARDRNFAQLQHELSYPEGFSSYQEISLWLSTCQNLEISYPTVHRITRYELGSKLKVPRPCHEKQTPGVIEVFKQHLQPEN